VKSDHAIICFFDQVFDKGVNPAITWTGYWTPLRYMLLLKLACLFDKDTARLAWQARIETDDAKAEEQLVSVCKVIRSRVHYLPDERSRVLIRDTLTWAIKHPGELYYNCKSKKDVLTVTPNLIGFQFAMLGIASRISTPGGASSIIVDQQSQFNQAQRTLAELYCSARGLPLETGPGMPKLEFSNIPEVPITFRSSRNCVGLEVVDIYLWTFKRLMEGKEPAAELRPIIEAQMIRGKTDEVSLHALATRWGTWFKNLPDPTPEQMEAGKKLLEIDERRRLNAIRGSD
jgi:hypothetical protein